MSGRLVYVTDVSPYHDPSGTRPLRERLAGAHGVLGQSAIAMAELARAAGLEFVHVSSVADMPPGTVQDATVLALFTIGETPWSGAIVRRSRRASARASSRSSGSIRRRLVRGLG